MFQLDRGDLDFGLYRIMNMMAEKITKFLDDDLLPQVKTILAGVSDEDRADLEKHIEDAKAMAKALGINPDDAPKVIELERQLAEARTDAEAEADVYGHLANFFSRYYSEGDFMSLRRYSGGGDSAYHIPYDGEEVKLHWANADQYYIKAAENYASYAFTPQKNRHVRFETVAANIKKDNIKEINGKQRRFVLARGKAAIAHEEDTLIVRFEHRPLTDSEKQKKEYPGNGNSQQNRINQATTERVLQNLDPDWRACLSELEPTTANGERTVLEKHVERYTAKNSFDYFIHKDLGGFLRREMDFYLKSEVFNLNDLNVSDIIRLRRAQLRMRAIHEMGEKIISFLEQLENFQKKLWLKKKFVLETHWCVTLDYVPEAFYAEIAANERQVDEWEELFSISEIDGSLANGDTGYSDPLSTRFLKANPYLILDTRHFNHEFTNRLLSVLSKADPLDDQADGLLIQGENFQALNLLRACYAKQVSCIYIDPPYNSPSSEIMYKNSFKHSSWICLIENRLRQADSLSSEDGVLIIAIDEHEREHLGSLLSQIYPDHIIFLVTIVHNKKGTQGDLLSVSNDYAYFVIPPQVTNLNKLSIPPNEWEDSNLRKWGNESERSTAKNCFYPIFVRDGSITGFGDVCDDDFHPDSANIDMGDGTLAIYPIDKKRIERKWRYSRDSIEDIKDILKVSKNGNGVMEILKPQTEAQIKTVWTDKKHIAGDFGTKLITNMGFSKMFDYPKSVHTVYDSIYASTDSKSIVLDFFAGSGTTGHATINLNREDGGKRKYILADMADYFNTVLLPRIKKAIYSPNWKDGKPASCDNGISQLFKYIRLESYEDTLDGLVWEPKESDLLADNLALFEDYQLRYSLDVETRNSANLLGMDCPNPFAYTISTVRDGVRQDVPVDLPETFNYLIGLRVHTYREIDNVLSITGTDSQKRNCLILWRNLEEIDNAKLEKWLDLNRKHFPDSLDLIYVNGDHTLNAIRKKKDTWTAETIEPVFRTLMFEDCQHGK